MGATNREKHKKILFACDVRQDSLAEWSKALASGASPKGRGFEPHSCHFLASRYVAATPHN